MNQPIALSPPASPVRNDVHCAVFPCALLQMLALACPECALEQHLGHIGALFGDDSNVGGLAAECGPGNGRESRRGNGAAATTTIIIIIIIIIVITTIITMASSLSFSSRYKHLTYTNISTYIYTEMC